MELCPNAPIYGGLQFLQDDHCAFACSLSDVAAWFSFFKRTPRLRRTVLSPSRVGDISVFGVFIEIQSLQKCLPL